MKNLIYFLLMWLSATAYAQVTGNAQLMGETDHSGIKVLFTAVSPTAKTDSTLTDVNGRYTINLRGGIYKIIYLKKGFQNFYYQNNTEVVIATNSILNNVLLLSGDFLSIQGQVKGRFYKNYTYIINGDLELKSGDTLVIEPGTTLRFNGYYQFKIYGVLIAEGLENSRIAFTSNKQNSRSNDWYRLSIENSNSIFKNCLFEYGTTALECKNTNVVVSNCEFRNLEGTGIYAYNGGSPIIENNYLHDLGQSGISVEKINTNIKCNRVINCKVEGIHFVFSDISVENNYIENCGVGIYNGYLDGTINNNYINNCQTGININSYSGVSQKTIVTANTITNNNEGLVIEYDDFILDISSNIYFNNNTAIKVLNVCPQPICTNQNKNINHNLFYFNNYNFSQINLSGIGVVVDVNINNDEIDSYYNLYENPNFIKNIPPLLSKNSPTFRGGVVNANIGFYAENTCMDEYFHNYLQDTLSISGKINVSGANVISASVKAVNVLTNREFVANADLSGNFVIDSLPLGKYYIQTTPLADLSNSYLTTYYPQRATLQQADTINIQGKIIDMQIYLVSKTTVGLDDEELVSKIYPNPFKDQLIVENKSNEQITVSDVSGRVMFAGQQMSEPINTQAWQSGMYFVKINNQVMKFVKE